MILSLIAWLAMQLPYYSVDCDPQMRNGKEYQQCAVDAPAEHVIEIKTVRDDKKAAVGVEKPAPFPCNVNDGPYLTCTTSSVIHWSCADKDHQLAGGFDELLYIDPKHPNNPYCERVTRELWIDGVRWGVVKGLE